MGYDEYVNKGQFTTNQNTSLTPEELYEESSNSFYFLLDGQGMLDGMMEERGGRHSCRRSDRSAIIVTLKKHSASNLRECGFCASSVAQLCCRSTLW